MLPLLVEFYHKCVASKDQAEIDTAGKLFAQAILRGGLDVIDILFAGGAVRRLTVLGGGRITARAVWVYLEERIGLLVARLRKGASRLERLMQKYEEVISGQAKERPYPSVSSRRTGAHAGDGQNIASDGYRIEAKDVEANSRSIEGVEMTSRNIEKIKTHLSRPDFLEEGELAANNKVMIERLEKIQRGEIKATLIDQNFHAHELIEQ